MRVFCYTFNKFGGQGQYPLIPFNPSKLKCKEGKEKKMTEQSANLKPFSFKEYEKGAEVVFEGADFKILKIIKIDTPEFEFEYLVLFKIIESADYIFIDKDGIHNVNGSMYNVFIKPKITIKHASVYELVGQHFLGPYCASKLDAKLNQRADLKFVGVATIEIEV